MRSCGEDPVEEVASRAAAQAADLCEVGYHDCGAGGAPLEGDGDKVGHEEVFGPIGRVEDLWPGGVGVARVARACVGFF